MPAARYQIKAKALASCGRSVVPGAGALNHLKLRDYELADILEVFSKTAVLSRSIFGDLIGLATPRMTFHL